MRWYIMTRYNPIYNPIWWDTDNEYPKLNVVLPKGVPYFVLRLPKNGSLIPLITQKVTPALNVSLIGRINPPKDPKLMDLYYIHMDNSNPITKWYYDTEEGVIITTVTNRDNIMQSKSNPEPITSPQDDVIDTTGEVIDRVSGNPDKIQVTCKKCNHVYYTNVYYNPDGSLDTKKTQARCSKCKRKNTTQVIKLIEQGTTVSKLTGKEVTPIEKDAPLQPPQTPQAKVTLPNTPQKPVTQVTLPGTPEKKDTTQPGVTPQTPVVTPIVPIMDMTVWLHIIHSYEGTVLLKKRGIGLSKEEVKFLDDMGNASLQQTMSNPAMAKFIPYLPIFMYLTGQALVIRGPEIVNKLTQEAKEGDVKE